MEFIKTIMKTIVVEYREPIEDTIYLFILGVFVYSLIQEFLTTSKYKKEHDEFRKDIGKFDTEPTAELQALHCPDLEIESDNLKVFSAYPSLLHNPVSASNVSMAPSLLTAIGVLGTFFGIAAGLNGLDIDTNNSEQTMDAVVSMINGMKTAFNTSLAGLGSAALIIAVLAVTKQFRKKLKSDSLEQFKKKFVIQTPTMLLSTLIRIQASKTNADAENLKASQALGSAAEQMQRSMATMEDSFREFKPEIIGDRVSEAIDQSLTPEMQRMNSTLSDVSQMMREQNEDVVKNLIQEMKAEVFGPVTEQLKKSAATTAEAARSVTTLSTELGGVLQTIQEFQTDTLTKMQSFTGNLESILTDFKTETSGVLKNVATAVDETVQKGVESMQRQEQAFTESAVQARTTFQGIKDEMVKALTERAAKEQEMLRETRDGVDAVLQKAQQSFAEQSHTLTRLGAESTSLMDNARNSLVGTLSNIDSELQKTVFTVEQQLTSFRDGYTTSLNQFFEEQNTLLGETLGKHEQGLATVVNQMTDAFVEEYKRRTELGQELRTHLNTLVTISEEVQTLVDAVGVNKAAHYSQLVEAARMVNDNISKMQKEQRDLHSTYQNLVKAGDSALLEYTRMSNEHNQKFYSEMDKHSARIFERLASAAEYLISGAQEQQVQRERQ